MYVEVDTFSTRHVTATGYPSTASSWTSGVTEVLL
ncbi:MAG: hypothetical protein K0Q93_3214, partial [Nocardioidaceae bacterium]|nr:hypothetical protein [Nocardioidaceae bacterium]